MLESPGAIDSRTYAGESGPLLGVNGLSAWYGESHVLHGVAFEVLPGEVVTLLGRNGAGKTTTLRTIMGLWPTARGSVTFDGQVIGGATLLPLPPDEEFEIGWQLQPRAWGHGYASEAGVRLARWAFEQGIEQVVALVRPANTRAVATVRRIGMEWVGETEKYHGLRLQEFRLRPGDLTAPPAR